MPRGSSRRLDLAGREFGRWTVVARSHHNSGGEVYWLCECQCGQSRQVRANTLTSGRSTSCGCYHREAVSTHGMYGLRTFKSWESMKQRCLNPNAPDYERYGGRGIKVCVQWASSFDQFYRDMGERPAGMTLDRIDGNGDYEPGNCRWASLKTQQRNRQATPRLTINGATKTYAEWSELRGVPSKVIGWRIAKGWSPDRAVSEPVRPKRPRS